MSANPISPDTQNAIVEDFNGSNYRELSRKYNLPVDAIYSAIRNVVKASAPIVDGESRTRWEQVKADLAAERLAEADAAWSTGPTTHPYLQQAVIKDFNGANHRELALKYDLTVATIYAITRRGTADQPKPAAKPLNWLRLGLVLLLVATVVHSVLAWLTAGGCLSTEPFRIAYMAANAMTLAGIGCLFFPVKNA
jgi:hypothetical protein